MRNRPEFERDLEAQVSWLRANRPVRWIEGLRDELGRLHRLLRESPAIGIEHIRQGSTTFRVIRLGRLPHVVWFYFDDRFATSSVKLARLFHEHQDRPDFSPEEWT